MNDGNDTMLAVLGNMDQALQPVELDDYKREVEEDRVRAQPSDGNLG